MWEKFVKRFVSSICCGLFTQQDYMFLALDLKTNSTIEGLLDLVHNCALRELQ